MTVMNTYNAGAQVRLQGEFKNSTGGGADPTAVKLLYKNSTGTVTTKTTTALSTGSTNGIYYFDLSISSTERTGIWTYRFEGTGAIVAAGQDVFKIVVAEVST